MKKIGYLGPAGTFSEKAAQEYLRIIGKNETVLVSCKTIPTAFQSMEEEAVEAIVVPAENSIEGTVNMTLDLMFLHPELCIMREIIFNINHCLLTREENTSRIKKIFSHPHALAQCKNYLDKHYPGVQFRSLESTAEATILASKTPYSAAIASEEAAEKYGLQIVARAIQDFRTNMTCFWVIGRDPISRTGDDKTSLVFSLSQNRPGGLYEILGVFAEADIDLTKIQSRPTKKELGEYIFHVDLIGHKDDEHIKRAFTKLEEKCSLFRILGSYPRGGN